MGKENKFQFVAQIAKIENAVKDKFYISHP